MCVFVCVYVCVWFKSAESSILMLKRLFVRFVASGQLQTLLPLKLICFCFFDTQWQTHFIELQWYVV